MSLPQLITPTYNLHLPMSDQEVKFRPFLVKEEKILLLAMESEDKDKLSAIMGVIDDCTFHKLKLDDLSMIDVQMLLINLKSKSKGEKLELTFECKNVVNEETGSKCLFENDVFVDLSDIKVDTESIIDEKIKLTDSVGIAMKPTKMVLPESKNDINIMIDIIFNSTDYIWDSDEIFKISDTTKKDFSDFIGSLTSKQLEKIKKYLDSLPTLKVDVPFKCSNCNYEETITVDNFFDFLA